MTGNINQDQQLLEWLFKTCCTLYQIDNRVAYPKILDSAQLSTVTRTMNLSVYYSDSNKGVLTDAFFDKTNFIGALDATNDWTAGWAVWSR